MRSSFAPALVCELHAHSTWSDGRLPLGEVVNLYGRARMDVLCITDHVLRRDDPWLESAERPVSVDETTYFCYLEAIEREAERARSVYDLLVVPGLELTYNAADPDGSAHVLAIGIRSFVPVDAGIVPAVEVARGEGAAIIAAHPHDDATPLSAGPATRYVWRQWKRIGNAIDRFELFNRRDVFRWVANEGLPAVASGDFHRPEHLRSWKTLLPCEKSESAVVEYLRSRRPAYLGRLDHGTLPVPWLAAA